MNEQNPTAKIATLIKATPYRHQIEAFNFVCEKFGLAMGGDAVESALQQMRKNHQPETMRVAIERCQQYLEGGGD